MIGPIAGCVFDHGHEYILDDVLRDRCRSGDVRGEAVDVRPVSSIQQRESGTIAGAHSGD